MKLRQDSEATHRNQGAGGISEEGDGQGKHLAKDIEGDENAACS